MYYFALLAVVLWTCLDGEVTRAWLVTISCSV